MNDSQESTVEQIGRQASVVVVVGIWAVLGAIVGYNVKANMIAAVFGSLTFAGIAVWSAKNTT